MSYERPSRLAATALFDDVSKRVEIGGQVFGADGQPIVGADLVIRASWGIECSTTSAALGSFGARFTAPDDAVGKTVIVEADFASKQISVQ